MTPALDILIHNAGVLHEGGLEAATPAIFKETMSVNVAAPIFLTQALLPALRAAVGARVVLISSRAGLLADDMPVDNLIYRVSKAAVNALTVRLATELSDDGISVQAVHPGWLQTRMGGPKAVRSTNAAASEIVNGLLRERTPTGVMLEYGEVVPW